GQAVAALGVFRRAFDPQHFVMGDAGHAFHVVDDENLRMIRRRSCCEKRKGKEQEQDKGKTKRTHGDASRKCKVKLAFHCCGVKECANRKADSLLRSE